MASKAILLTLICGCRLAAQSSGWASATQLPDVDFAGLTAAQKQTALKLMREESCSCGCSMKLAQCRVEDPKCSYSKGLTAKTLKAVKEGRSVAEIRTMLEAGAGPQQILADAVPLNTDGAPVKGPANARITLVEFSDFECPYCSVAVKELEAIQAAFPNDVKLVFKQFPLAAIHPRAMLAAQAALAAHNQGKFWPMHDRMFANRTKLTRDNILAWAAEVQCDVPKFTTDLDAAKTKQQIARDLQQGEEAGVEGTPSVYVNGQHYNGSLALQPFSAVLKEQLQQQIKPEPKAKH